MTADPFASLQAATRAHRRNHGCQAYTFEDGPALTRISTASGALRILELGTALGYTACCLAAGRPDARVDTIEGDDTHASLAQQHIASVGLSERISVHHGTFSTVLPTLPSGYDLVFFDGYAPDVATLDRLTEILNVGGTLVCANLGLAADSHHLMKLLNNAAVWIAADPIEGGSTVVRIKKR